MLEIGEKVVPLVIDDDERREVLDIDLAVSYTHLTLPTSDLV